MVLRTPDWYGKDRIRRKYAMLTSDSVILLFAHLSSHQNDSRFPRLKNENEVKVRRRSRGKRNAVLL